MSEKCLYCYQELKEGQRDYHPACARRFFGSATPPVLPYSRQNISELASEVIRSRTTLTGVQPKLSMDINRG
ncbi:MAG: type II toxin-antitoxin system HipA family toxin, partial [Prevotella sp.]|nr:type II toxin-antitoxin system HipA family toxin [Prevotella sp.]